MSTHASDRRSLLCAMAGLDEATFGDERERRIWMESYVIAYEVALLATFGLATLMVWLGDRSVAMWSLGVVWVVGAGNFAALAHLRNHGLSDLPWRARWSFWSYRLRMLLCAAWLVGFLLAVLGEGGNLAQRGGWTYVAGLVVGAGAVVAALVVVDRRSKRRAHQELPEDDSFDDR